jgi:hypothetical protein
MCTKKSKIKKFIFTTRAEIRMVFGYAYQKNKIFVYLLHGLMFENVLVHVY